LVGEACPPQSGVKPVSRSVSRENTTSAVAAVRRRGEADYAEPGIRVAEARDGTPPIFLTCE
jgi:hypothetical protein